MRRPQQVVAAVAALVVAATLSSCGLGADASAPVTTPVRSSASPTPTASDAPALPDGVLLRLTATLRTKAGAELTVRMTVRDPIAWNSTAGAPIASRIAQTCAGELDTAAFASGDYAFLPLELSATAEQGDWAGTAIGIRPVSDDATGLGLVATGSATQIAAGAGSDPGDYVPHCAQPAVLTGAGSGEVDLAYESGDAAPGTAPWRGTDFGVGVAPTTDGSAPVELTVVDCEVVGAPASDIAGEWTRRESAADGTPACLARAS